MERHEKYEKLQAQLEKAEKVIEFYSNTESWGSVIPKGQPGCYEVQAIDKNDFEIVNYRNCGGKKARAYFKEKEKNK